MKKLTIPLFILGLVVPLVVNAATYYVAKTGNNSNSCSQAQNSSTPKLTIMGASGGISCMASGDTLQIRAGTYVENITNYGITIPSGGSWASATQIAAYPGETVVIQPTAGGICIDLSSSIANQYIIFDHLICDGVNISGGQTNIYVGQSHIRFTNIESKNNRSGGPGALVAGAFNEFLYSSFHNNENSANPPSAPYGMYIGGHDNLVDHCDVYHNGGYGIQIYNSSGGSYNNTVRNCKLWENGTMQTQFSAGIVLNDQHGGIGNNVIYNSLVYGNGRTGTVHNAGGIQGDGPNAIIYNNTIYNNSKDGYGVGTYGNIVRNNISFGNGGNQWVDNGTATLHDHNLDNGTNPLFVNAATNDFRLQSTSPAKDSGAIITSVPDDIMGIIRPQGSAHDIGAHEYTTSGGTLATPSNLVVSP